MQSKIFFKKLMQKKSKQIFFETVNTNLYETFYVTQKYYKDI